MSTGRRIAKRSIIGTKVCAPGPDGLWYSGVIQDVKQKSSPSATVTADGGNIKLLTPPPPTHTFVAPGETQLNADTRYIVRFDFKTQSSMLPADSVIVETRRANANAAPSVHISPAQALRRNAMIKEFRESDLIGPGFRSLMGIELQPGQRVFLTYNGREQSGDVVLHDPHKDEVVVKITTIGNEEPIELKKRLEEVRLLESRRSARLADQDRNTDFARLADMGGDRRRTTHSIEMSPTPLTSQHNTRKRPVSDAHDCSDQWQEDGMSECHQAAEILMYLRKTPHNASEKWLGSSPGSSSSASWSSGSASPPLSDDGHATHGTGMLSPDDASANARIRTTSVSTSDEGIVSDFKDDRKKKAKKFRCIWKGCNSIELTQHKIERHIRNKHLGKKARRSGDYDSCSDNEHEEEFYYTEDDDDDESVKTPTLSHRDMARPPHEDPEYQRQIVAAYKEGRAMNYYHHQQQPQQQQPPLHSSNNGRSMHHNNNAHITSTQQQQLHNNNTSCIASATLAHPSYAWQSTAAITVTANSTPNGQPQQQQQQQPQQPQHSTATLNKHARPMQRPSHSSAPYPSATYVHSHHHNYSNSSGGSVGSSSGSGSSSSNNSSPIIHSSSSSSNSSSANNMLQQLSQQNVTVTAHHSGQLSHQQQHHLSSVTITPNYHPSQQQQQQPQHQPQQQQQMRGQQQTTASNLVANNGQHMPLQHAAVQHAAGTAKHTPNSPNRRTRGENKKCRKVYGMERRDQWCTQCKWKKACSRFGD